MNSDRLESQIADWIHEGPERGPRHALDRALAATRRVDQRPGWTFPTRWLPQPVADTGTRVRGMASIALLLVLLLLALLAFGFASTGGLPRLHALLGRSADTLIAYGDGTGVYASRIDGSARQKLSGNVKFATSPVFSPDGSRVAFVAPSTAGGLGGRLMVVPLDGSSSALDVGRGLELVPDEVPSISWSPDGSRIAFAADVGGIATIFVSSSDGSSVQPITDATAERNLPTWSPDGSRIAFRETEPDGVRQRLRTVRPDGSDVQDIDMVIGSDASLSRLRWSPNSESVSYTLNVGNGTATKAIIDLGYGHTGELWSNGMGGFGDQGVAWSPDGHFLAFLTATDGVIVADDDETSPYNGHLRHLGPVADCWVDWSPDGSALYGGSPGDCGRVVVIPLAEPAAATTLPMSASGMGSWQPLMSNQYAR